MSELVDLYGTRLQTRRARRARALLCNKSTLAAQPLRFPHRSCAPARGGTEPGDSTLAAEDRRLLERHHGPRHRMLPAGRVVSDQKHVDHAARGGVTATDEIILCKTRSAFHAGRFMFGNRRRTDATAQTRRSAWPDFTYPRDRLARPFQALRSRDHLSHPRRFTTVNCGSSRGFRRGGMGNGPACALGAIRGQSGRTVCQCRACTAGERWSVPGSPARHARIGIGTASSTSTACGAPGR